MQHLVTAEQIQKQIVMACYLEILNLFITNTQAVQHLQPSTAMFHISLELGQKKFQLICLHHILKQLQSLASGRTV